MFSRIEPGRKHQRLDISVPVEILCRETPDKHWREHTDTLDITAVGVRFTLSRPLSKGRLIRLTMNMPVQLRKYAHTESEYEVWAAVRFVSSYKLFGRNSSVDEQYEIGVALIGQTPPESYLKDPSLCYELAPPEGKNGFWIAYLPEPEVEDEETETITSEVIEVIVEVLDLAGKVIEREETLTRNMSETHAVIPITVNIQNGHLVRLLSPDGQNVVMARATEQTTDENGITRVSLRFMGSQWHIR